MDSNCIVLDGTYERIGQLIGSHFKDKIRELIHVRKKQFFREMESQKVTVATRDLDEICNELSRNLQNECSEEYDELKGIAASSGTLIQDLVFVCGYSDVIDLYLDKFDALVPKMENRPSCTSFMAIGSVNSDKLSYGGQTWDMPPDTENYMIIAIKRPVHDKAFLSVSTVAGLTHIGVNENGLCIGTNKLVSSDVQEGVFFSALIQSSLLKNDMSEAKKLILTARRAAGHNYYLVSKGEGLNIEATARQTAVDSVRDDIYIHANHYISPKLRPIAIDYSPSSFRRAEAMREKLVASRERLCVEDFQSALSMHDGPICRHGEKASFVKTCSGIIFNPESSWMRISFGPPCMGNWNTYSTESR